VGTDARAFFLQLNYNQMTTSADSKPDCCPEFIPTVWDDQLHQWENKKFIKDSVCTIFYMPLNFGQVMKRLDRKASLSGAKIPDWLCLSDHTSKWSMDLYLAVDRDVREAENTAISGNFYTKVYEGPFRDTEKWYKDFENLTATKGYAIKKTYMWYTTCPKCAKKYGKNYVVVFGQIDEAK
jgi:hypothetical protein